MAKKAAKVEQAEYADPAEVKAEATTEEAPKATKAAEEWKVGQPAPGTRYFDLATGEVSDQPVHRGQILVFEGDIVTPRILRQLGLA